MQEEIQNTNIILSQNQYIVPSEKLSKDFYIVQEEGFTEKTKEIISSRYNITIRQKDIDNLEENNWLNDSIIDFFVEFLKDAK